MPAGQKVQGLRGGACLLGGVLLLSLCGCGSSGEGATKRDRASASGKVEFDGKPIPAGAVVFTHIESGTVVSCPITNGSYANERDAAPVIGKSAVSVVGMDKVDGKNLWNGIWSKQVEVKAPKFAEDFSVQADQVKPFVDKGSDEEQPLWK